MKFEDVLEIKNGKNQKAVENPNGLYPIYGSGGIMGYADDYICKGQTVIIGRKGSINSPIFVEEPFWNVDTAFGLCAKTELLLPKYLYYFCKHFDFEKLNKTVTIPSLTKSDLLKIEIDLPSLSTQRAVVDRLLKIELIIRLRKKELQILDDIIKARFVEMFGDPESDEKFPQIAIKDLTDVICGGTPDRKNNEYWEFGTVPWVKTTELQNNKISTTEEFITEKGLNGSSAKIVPKDTVLIAMYGQGKTRGMTAILEIPASTNQACACVLPCEKVDSKYLWYYMIISYERLRNLAQGGNQPNLNGNIIKNFSILVPPKELQSQFVQFIEQVDKSELAIQKALDNAQLLFNSLMQKYFD